MDEQFEPLFIKTEKLGTPGPEHRLEVAKYTVKAVEFACYNKLKHIVVCNMMHSPIGGLSMVTSLTMDNTDYVENLDYCLSILEEEEEYELCSKILELKEIIPTIEFTQEKSSNNILDIISDL